MSGEFEEQEEMQEETQEEEQEDNYEEQAREMGWVPEDKFKGPKDKWVDAKTFIERGEHIMPILQANKKRLEEKVLTQDKEIDSLRKSLEAADKSIKTLQKHYTEATKQAVEKAQKELREQLKMAREVGDVDAEEDIRDKLQDLKDSSKEVENKEEGNTEKPNEESLSPDFKKWQKENSWFGDTNSAENRKRTRAIIRIAEDLRDEGDKTEGFEFMDKCLDILEKQEGKQESRRTVSKVEGSGGGVRSGGRAFDSLPKEAKATCHDDADNFVGPGKMFKTMKEWEDHYAKLYNE